MPTDDGSLRDAEAIIPNLHWRYSGVTATNRMVAPRLARLLPAVWLGPDAPPDIRRIGTVDLFALRRISRARGLIWHARRNNEMIAGLLLRLLGWRLSLVFTSAGQRRHTWITRFLMRRMDAVIATSEASASFVQRAVTIIPHGVDTGLYRPPEDRARAFAESGLPGRYGVGCFGRVRAQKGTDVFVEAMCRLLPEFPDFSAVVVGAIAADQQGFADGLQQKVAAAGLSSRLHFFGELPIAEVPAWYRRIAIYAFTSRNEGFGLTLLEAMASATAVVAARAGAADTIIEHGINGILVPPGDAGALVDALRPLMADMQQAEDLGQKARSRVLADFTIEAEAERIAAVYRSTLGAESPAP